MRLRILNILLCLIILLNANAQHSVDTLQTGKGPVLIHPVQHASFIFGFGNRIIYVDPAGGPIAFKGMKPPDIILITDIHGDHLDRNTIDSIKNSNTLLVVPKAVADKLTGIDSSKIVILNNGEKAEIFGTTITAVPMYNLPEDADSRHTKGRGNGYVLSVGGKNIYISGDTEDIPEMRKLKDIDVAFICMNLPYTMDINQAASAVLEFRPRIVYPYHYRGQNGFSDVNAFKKLVNDADKKIDVRLINWYPSH